MQQAFYSMPPIENPPPFLMKFLKPTSLNHIKGLGKENYSVFNTMELSAVRQLQFNFCLQDKTPRFSRILINGTIFTTLSWHESHRRNNSTVQFTLNSSLKFGQISSFLKLNDTNFLAFITLLECRECDVPVDGLYVAEPTPTLIAINATYLSKCVLMEVEDKLYVSEPMDTFEKD